jgi:hypothetical protein
MARSSDVRKPPLPRVSMGLGNILAQSRVVADAFGRWPGFTLVLLALVASAVMSGSLAYLVLRGIGRIFG